MPTFAPVIINVRDMARRFFRFHRGGFLDSMETRQEVAGLSDVKAILGMSFPEGYLSNIRISDELIRDPRTAGSEWGEDTYMVLADFDGYTGQCLGYVNFRETLAYVVTRCEEHADYVEKVFLDGDKAEDYCRKFQGNDDEYARHITKVEIE